MIESHHSPVDAAVEAFLAAGADLAELPGYLHSVPPELRAEAAARCEEAWFVHSFLEGPHPMRAQVERGATFGEFEVVEPIGDGAMGVVFRAVQIPLGRDVALKLVRGELSHRPDLVERFRREARTLAALDHPGLVKVHAAGTQDGWFYYAMDYVPGDSLERTLAALSLPLQPEHRVRECCDEIARLLAEVLETLSYAHSRGVTHRDIKPSNIVIGPGGRPRLVDFGLARRDDSPLVTRPGTLTGTPAYLSPESVAGHPHPRTSVDLWGVGVILFQCLAGALPYAGASSDEVLAALRRPGRKSPRQLCPRVPAALDAICARALAPDREARYPDAASFAADLRRWLARQPVAAQRARRLRALGAWLRKHRRSALVALGLAALGAAAWRVADAHHARAAAAADLRAVLDGAAPPALGGKDLLLAHTRLGRLLENGALGADDEARAADRLGVLEHEARQRFARGRALLAQGAGSPLGTPAAAFHAPSQTALWEGMQLVQDAVHLIPELGVAAQLAQETFPQVVVGEDQPELAGAHVAVRPVDIDSGDVLPAVRTGAAPVRAHVPPGLYRIEVTAANGDRAELTRVLMFPGEYRVRAPIVPTRQALAGMVLIAAGRARIGQDRAGARIYAARDVELPPFYIDVHETTCAQYRRYAEATGARWPRRWVDADGQPAYESAWDELPVIGITWEEAQACAEWYGKRLPSWAEWQVAARSAAGWLWPWGDDEGPFRRLPTIGAPPGTPWYEAFRAVGTTPQDTSAFGVRDMLGNADEWTDTVFVTVWKDAPFPLYPWRIRAGNSALEPVRPQYASLDIFSPGPPEHGEAGFRCAKSAGP